MVRETGRLLKAAAIGWWNDRAMSLGAAIAFFTTFSLAPMLLAAIAVASLVFGREAAQGALVAELAGVLGEDAAKAIEAMIASAANMGSGVIGTTVGLVTFLILVTGAVIELQDDLNLIWKVKPKAGSGLAAFARTRLLSFALILGIGFLLLVSLVVDAALSAVGSYMEASFSGATAILWILNNLVSFTVATALFAMIFKILPDVDLTWRDVGMGAAVTAILFTIGKSLIGLYLGQSNIASSYGAAASVMTVQLWVYYSSLILLYGAEFTKAFAESRGSRRAARHAQAAQAPARTRPGAPAREDA
jgi:membrane protein